MVIPEPGRRKPRFSPLYCLDGCFPAYLLLIVVFECSSLLPLPLLILVPPFPASSPQTHRQRMAAVHLLVVLKLL